MQAYDDDDDDDDDHSNKVIMDRGIYAYSIQYAFQYYSTY